MDNWVKCSQNVQASNPKDSGLGVTIAAADEYRKIGLFCHFRADNKVWLLFELLNFQSWCYKHNEYETTGHIHCLFYMLILTRPCHFRYLKLSSKNPLITKVTNLLFCIAVHLLFFPHKIIIDGAAPFSTRLHQKKVWDGKQFGRCFCCHCDYCCPADKAELQY